LRFVIRAVLAGALQARLWAGGRTPIAPRRPSDRRFEAVTVERFEVDLYDEERVHRCGDGFDAAVEDVGAWPVWWSKACRKSKSGD